jgi:hypothetical protein
MALSKGAASFQFRGGIQRKSDEKTVPATQLLLLENGVFTKGTSIAKRNGYDALGLAIDGTTSTLTDPIQLGKRGEELIAFTRTGCYSHQPGADRWGDVGTVFSVIGADRPVVRTGTEQTMPDHATSDGVTVYAWEDSRGGVYYTVTDEVSGRVHVAATQADANGLSPRCLAVGDVLHIYYANATRGYIYVIVVEPGSPSATLTPAILVEDLDVTNPVYDACATSRAGTPALIAWHESATTNIRIGYVDAPGALGSPSTGHPSVHRETSEVMHATSPIAVAYTDDAGSGVDGFALAFGNATTGFPILRYSTGSSSVPIARTSTSFVGDPLVDPQRIALAYEATGTGNVWAAVEEAAVVPSNRFCMVVDILDGTATYVRSVGLASRAWSTADRADVFAYFVHDTTYFNVYLALRLSDFVCVARSLPGLASDAPARKHLPSVHVADDVATLVLPYNERLLAENNDQFTETGIRLVTLDFDSDDSHQHAQLGRGLYLAGACPQHYDGRQWTEQGFHVGPEMIATSNGTGGSLTASTTYLYRAWYEWTDAQGEIHRGPVSFGTTVTMAGGEDEVTLTLPTLRVTKKQNVRICVARSEAAKTGRTASLFRVTSSDPSTVGAANGYVANDTSADTVSFNDRMSDVTLATQEPLYTNGGLLSNDPCALGNVMAVGKSRIFATDPSDGNAIRFSQSLDEGYGVEFTPELVTKCDPFGGDVTALAVQDGEVIAWKRGAIFSFNGDGPLANGDTATSGFSSPRLVSSDVGCTEPDSIVLTPNGHIFKSEKGLYLIDRSGQVSYVGAPAEAFNAQRVTAANILPGRSSIVFLTDDGTTLLYDYLFGQWSTFTNHLGLDAHVIDGVYHYLRTDGRVFKETPGAYSDAGQRIALRLETAWIHVAEALQGFQRFWNLLLLGTWISAHQLRIQHRTNYSGSWSDPRYLDATGEATSTGWITGDNADTIGTDPITGSVYGDGAYGDGAYGGSAADLYQYRYHIGGRGQSVQFRFEDFERDGLAGASFELTEMLIEGGVAGPSTKPFTGARSA